MLQKGKDGRYVRTRKEWTPKNWDNGYKDSRGRVRVYFPRGSKSWSSGYTFRYNAVWEWYRGSIPTGKEVHHKDGDILNDKLENLILLTHEQHAHHHNRKLWRTFICTQCGQFFQKDGTHGARGYKFCSQKCYQKQRGNSKCLTTLSAGEQVS